MSIIGKVTILLALFMLMTGCNMFSSSKSPDVTPPPGAADGSNGTGSASAVMVDGVAWDGVSDRSIPAMKIIPN